MRLRQLEQVFAKANSLEELNKILKQCLAHYQITTFAFTYYAFHPHSKNKLKYDHCSKNFLLWHQHYLNEAYEQVDTTLTEAYQTTLPVFWDLQEQLLQSGSEKERQMRLDSIAFGAEKGLSIPIHGPNDDFAILLLVQMKNQTCLANWNDLQDDLIILAKCYYHYLQKCLVLQSPSDNQYQLTQRELQCIYLTAKKNSVNQIAHFLKIKERTVNFHLQRANKKLGVQNKYQSVAKAIAKGILVL